MPYTNKDIIDELYTLYEQPMYYEAYKILHDKYLAEDAVHEAFLRLIRNRKKILDPNSPAVRRYVFKTVNSAALDIYRQQKKQHEHCLGIDESTENAIASEEDSLVNLPLSLISDLPPKYASVLRCLFLDGLNTKETAAVLKVSESLVRKRCERARKILKSTPLNHQKEAHNER